MTPSITTSIKLHSAKLHPSIAPKCFVSVEGIVIILDAGFLFRRQMTHAGQFSLCLFFYLYRKVSVFIYNAYSFCCLSFFLVNFRGRGFLSLEEVYEALIKLGFSLDSPAFYTVCESFDKSKKGMVHLDEFISLCIFVQSARNLFNSFDTSKQGRVSLDFNQFVYCTANCRI